MSAYLPALAGGALIGVAAPILLLLNGRIAGISGIAGKLLEKPDADAPFALSGMMNPLRVPGFLDFAGDWVPSLAFVLAGAVGVSTLGYAVQARIRRPALVDDYWIPISERVNPKLLLGAALFGIGWGLVGLCPGPAVAALVLGLPRALLFVVAMLAGMALYRLILSAPAVPSDAAASR